MLFTKIINIVLIPDCLQLLPTFGGMWRCRRVAVARVFALVVRCRVMMLVVYSRVGKNRDTRRESPAGAGAGRTADHPTVLFSQKILAVRKANCIYRPVSNSILLTQLFGGRSSFLCYPAVAVE
jgi:hypothetical protein